MKFYVRRASGYYTKTGLPNPICKGAILDEDGHWSVELNSIEELMALVEEEGPVIVDTGKECNGEDPQQAYLLIYDDYVD